MSEMANVKTGVDPDPNASISRVPSQSYWAELAQKELEEASKNPVRGIHTVLCVDTSDRVRQGSAWEQTHQFFNDFVKGLEEARIETDVDAEYVALSVFGGDVKVVQRLTTNYTLLQEAFSALRLGGPSPLVGGLSMALAGLSTPSRPRCNGIRIRPRIILITDGHPTNSLIASGPDVCHSEPLEQVAVLFAVSTISSKVIQLNCVSVGDANLAFLEKISAQSHGKLYSYKDGRMLARRTLCTFRAGHVVESLRKLSEVSRPFGIELSLEDAMRSNFQIASSSAEEQEEILHIAREALETNPEDDDDAEMETDHYERDESDVSLPCLGTRVRRGPDWDKGVQDSDGPGTIVGHHKDKKQVKVEWDNNRHSGFYHYGDNGQYDVLLIDNEPRVLQSELIATGCRVRRGKHWKYDNQDGTPGAIGIVLKVQEDGIVVVRWPNKSKNYYRYGAEGCFDLEVCHPEEVPAESKKSIVPHPECLLEPDSFIKKEAQTHQDSIQKYHNESLRLPALGTRVRRGFGWHKGQQDHNRPGTIIGHDEDNSQVYVEWDVNRQRDFYYFNDMESSEVVVVDEPRTLSPWELIVTGCHVKRGKSLMYGNDNGTADNTGVVLDVREDGMVLVRWPDRSKHYYRFGADGCFDLEICNPFESHTARIRTQPSGPFSLQSGHEAVDDGPLSLQSTLFESKRILDAKDEDDLDLKAPVSRVPNKSYWSDLAHKELTEGLKSPVAGVHTVLCVDTSASTRLGSAWGQTQQFFNEFITGLEEVRKEPNIGTDNVALSVFGEEVKIVQPLTNNYTLLYKAFSTLQPGGPSPLYGGLLMAAAALQDIPNANANNSAIRIRPQIIVITDGHPTDCLISAGPDVWWSNAKDQDDVLLAVKAIASINVDIHCVPVGNANLTFLERISAAANGKLFPSKCGGMLARTTICTDVVEKINLETLDINIGNDEEAEVVLDHYEIDDPDVKLPSLGTRVRRGPDWNKSFQDKDGPGTIVSHHKNQKQVKVEWDKSGHTDFYRYGDLGKYDVLIDSEPRALQSELIATGCLVRRGEHWKYDDQDGTLGAIGVVLKVKDDGMVVVRWPNKFKGHYRYGADGFFDLEICDPFESQTAGVATKTRQQSTPQLGPETAAFPLSDQTLNTESIETVNEKDEGLPPEILQMDEHGQELFKKALQAGKVEVNNIRVMVVGQKGVGKTTLTQRIQGLDVTETLATKGINVHAGCCKIDHETKEWCAAKSGTLFSAEENLFYCIYNYLNMNREETKIRIQQEQQRFSIFKTQPLHLLTSNPGENQAVNVIPTDLDNNCKIEDGDNMEERTIVLHPEKAESNQNVSNKGQNVDTISENRSETVRCSSSQSEFINKFVEWVKSKKYKSKIFSKVTMLDFAGEFLFYTTHQIFISGHTLYLLVTDISKPLSEIVEGGTYSLDMNENKKGSIQDYVIYWMNSIFCHAQPAGGYSQLHGDTIQQEEDLKLGEEKVVESKPVLLVATHLDKFQVEERDNKTRNYFKTVEDALRDRPFIHLIGGTIAIGNFGSDFQSDIDRLKTQIFEMAQKQPYWKHQVPVMWLALEQKLLEEKVRKPIIGLAEIRELDTAYVASIEKTGELEVFLDFEHKLGNILYFRTEKLKSKAVLDPVWLIDALQILHSSDLSAIRSGQGVKQCSPETAKHFHEFKKTGRITQSLMEYLWSEKEDEIFRQNQEYLLGVMEEMDIIVQPLENEKGPEKYYWVPSMIQDSAPEKVMNPGANKITNVRTRTSTLCFVSKTKFIHVGVFHRLVASCLSKWAPAEEEKKYQLYRGCCLFTVSDADDDGCHELLLALNDFVIQATVIRLTYEAKEPKSDICIGVREFIYTTLSDIASWICPNTEFDFYIKCDRSSIYTTKGLLKVSGKKETKCNCSKSAHLINLQEEMKFWERREGNLPTNVLPSTLEGDKVRFMRIAFLYTDVASKVLRRLLHYYVVKPGYTFEQFLKDNRHKIYKRVNDHQYAVMFPKTGTSDRKDYDVSLTSLLLLNFVNINPIYKPYIESVRTQRNKDLAHKGHGRMDPREYCNCWNKITGELIYLSEACDDPDFVYEIKETINEIEHRRLGNQ